MTTHSSSTTAPVADVGTARHPSSRVTPASNPGAATYVGRFAPSPTGSLHFGSLLAALASFLDARAHQGRWLVRIEDLDPPREVPGAADDILRSLEQFGLFWDGEISYQSHNYASYQQHIELLLQQQLAFYCDCSRQQILQRTGAATGEIVYDGYCRSRQQTVLARQKPSAIRLAVDQRRLHYQDRIQGLQEQQLSSLCGDFVIRRKDGLYAYQLAVVCDDQAQQVTHIVRGSDLLDSTPRQLYLQQLLGFRQPCYAHIPVMLNEHGQKLSKQTFATALNPQQPTAAIFRALQLLGQQPPDELRREPLDTLLGWAINHWSIDSIPAALTLAAQEQ